MVPEADALSRWRPRWFDQRRRGGGHTGPSAAPGSPFVQRFQGRRGEVLEKESRDRVRIRRARSIRLMAAWLEAQALVNAGEGTSREEPFSVEGGVLEPGQSLITAFWS